MRNFSVQRVWGMVLRQWYEMRHSPDRIIDSFFWPALDVIVWGMLTFFIDSFSSFNATNAILGGIMFWAFTYSVQRDITMTTVQDLWDRNLYNVMASPLRPIELIVAAVLYATFRLVVLFLVLLGLAGFFYHFSFFIFLPFMFFGLLTVLLFGVAFGILTSGLIYRFGSNAQMLCWSGLAVLSPFAAITYPVASLPAYLHWISWLTPPTYVFEAVRYFVSNGAVPPMNAWIIPSLLNIVYIAISIWCFFYAFRHAKRRGWFVKMD